MENPSNNWKVNGYKLLLPKSDRSNGRLPAVFSVGQYICQAVNVQELNDGIGFGGMYNVPINHEEQNRRLCRQVLNM
jgi:hypothetical protein